MPPLDKCPLGIPWYIVTALIDVFLIFCAVGNMPQCHPLRFHMIFLILLMTMNTVKSHVTDTSQLNLLLHVIFSVMSVFYHVDLFEHIHLAYQLGIPRTYSYCSFIQMKGLLFYCLCIVIFMSAFNSSNWYLIILLFFLRCLSDNSCQGYQYKDQRTGLGECLLIHNGFEENFQSSSRANTYKKG